MGFQHSTGAKGLLRLSVYREESNQEANTVQGKNSTLKTYQQRYLLNK